ncbi:MAG: hypothetical protein JWO41_798 [Candidatus Saccharibacteria bacterium]|nr:hypothetical protein [Candidatus Saccharibacteria bacterium]
MLDYVLMSEKSHSLLAVFVDGETKTGKGAAGEAIAETLKAQGLNVHYDVAGDFYRRYVAMVRRDLHLAESDVLESTLDLEATAASLYDSGEAFDQDETLGDLQRPAISQSVAVLGELEIAQKAGGEWFACAVQEAFEKQADVIVLDGRNPRLRITHELPELGIAVQTALDLYMTCDVHEAARRVLVGRGLNNPSPEQIAAESQAVTARRELDRKRANRPFLEPSETVSFWPSHQDVADILEESWDAERFGDLPATIILDNTAIPKDEMLAAVTSLASQAVVLVKTSA